YTEATLDNLSYNVSINSKWLEDRGIDPQSISVGKLEWGESSTEGDFCLESADLLIAADVVYAREVIPDLVTTVRKFLSSGSSKVALFATTHRNRQTFELFEKELQQKGIICQYKSHTTMEYVFPCYFNQPRSDVRICAMRLKNLSEIRYKINYIGLSHGERNDNKALAAVSLCGLLLIFLLVHFSSKSAKSDSEESRLLSTSTIMGISGR
ncbi:hypothetical protein ACHAWC_000202, partial [Mediolabrus comicus]